MLVATAKGSAKFFISSSNAADWNLYRIIVSKILLTYWSVGIVKFKIWNLEVNLIDTSARPPPGLPIADKNCKFSMMFGDSLFLSYQNP